MAPMDNGPGQRIPDNRYCQRLGLPMPDLDTALTHPELKVAHLMALAVLEAGGPLSLEAIAERLGRLALPPRLAAAGNPASLRKAWHGQSPLVRDPVDGRFYLDLLATSRAALHRLPGRPPSRACDTLAAPAEFRQPPDSEPLSPVEVDAAFRDRTLDAYSSIRRAAAVLEASGGGPLSLEEINRRLVALGDRGAGIDERAVTLWQSDLVAVGPDGMLRLNAASPDLPAFRRDIRRMASARLRQQAEAEQARAWRAEHEVVRADEERRDIDEARRARRALVHIVVVDGLPRAAAVIDADGPRTTAVHRRGDERSARPSRRLRLPRRRRSPAVAAVGRPRPRPLVARGTPTDPADAPPLRSGSGGGEPAGDRPGDDGQEPCSGRRERLEASPGRTIDDPSRGPARSRKRRRCSRSTSTARSTAACAFGGARATACCRWPGRCAAMRTSTSS